MGKNKVIETTIGALIPDDKNFNNGTEYGKHLMDKSFSQFGAGRSVLIDKNNRIIAGNKSTEQFGENGGEKVIVIETTGDTLVAVKRTDIDLDSKEGREMALADNATAKANLDFDIDVVCDVCADLGIDAQDWGVSVEDVTSGGENATPSAEAKEEHGKLTDKFIVPPFTILDTRQGYWMERKQRWREIIGDNGESRENTLSSEDSIMSDLNNGVSILDPVMAEVVCKWFGVDGGNAFDCFAGDTIFGFVASSCGMNFTGIELREEQAALNNERTSGLNAHYICDDGQNVANHIERESQDLLFSCPPYYDLEVYSDKPNDASNQETYEDFLAILRNAFTNAITCLKPNRFAVVVVGDVRDKQGFYYDFPADIKRIFREAGVPLYNEAVLVEPIGTLPQRVANSMKTRKLGKCHKNVLIFYNGDPTQIKNNYPVIEYDAPQQGNQFSHCDDGVVSANGNELLELMEFRKQFIKKKFIMYLPTPKLQTALDKGNIHIERDESGKIIGYLWLENLKKKPISRIEEICSVRRGLGTRLIKMAIEEKTNPTLELKVVDYNDNAIKFYKHRGFVEVGRETGKSVNNITMNYAGENLE